MLLWLRHSSLAPSHSQQLLAHLVLLVKPPVIQAHDVAVLQLLQHRDLAEHARALLAAAAPKAAQPTAASSVSRQGVPMAAGTTNKLTAIAGTCCNCCCDYDKTLVS
jgi:hypothetical protein